MAGIDPASRRASEARAGKAIGPTGYRLVLVIETGAALAAIAAAIDGQANYAYLLAALALFGFMLSSWWHGRLATLPPDGKDISQRLSADILSRLKRRAPLTPQAVWEAISGHWHASFLAHHLLIPTDLVKGQLSTNETDLEAALQAAGRLADQNQSPTIEVIHLAGGLLSATPTIGQWLVQMKGQAADVEAVASWLGRNLMDQRQLKQNYGGIARDWAFGFTPLLDRFGHNISRGIMHHGAHFGWLTESAGVEATMAAFKNGAAAVVLVGADGIGKTNSAYALAQRLIEGNADRSLAYHQIIELNATDITSRARGPGELEQIMLTLANEAGRAGHIILFFDEAQLLLGGGPGAFDGTRILQSIIQARAVPVILALTPSDYQRLRAQNTQLAGALTPVMLQELPENDVMRVLEDAAIGLENRHHVLIAYEALREAYRLSGRYEQDEAYPGKAIKLLEQSVSHANQQVVTAGSVQAAIEQTRGVKAGSAAPAEADQLLHLEDTIHQRMINQTHAVGVVANALRRSRAGVTNPRRPIGSFLFLGPTGVGKTELAKAVAASYFGAESNLVRLDMSEYQGADDARRLLSAGREESNSLLLAVRRQPFSVVLLDEIEKAHPNILNLLLQMLDEGQLTDTDGRPASFKDCIIIATSNAGANTIRERIGRGESLESFSEQFTDELIQSGQFKPELLNRFDEMVLFRPLTPEELTQVVRLMLADTNRTLANQNISVELTDAAINEIVDKGNDPRLGARPMRRVLQRAVEDTVAQKILSGAARPGDKLTLDAPDLKLG